MTGKLFITSCMLFVLTPFSVSMADFNVDRNGVVWPATYEGNFAPLNDPFFGMPPWEIFDNNGFASETSDGDIYSLVSGSTGVSSAYQIQDSTWNDGTAARTVEFRARVPNNDFAALDGSGQITLGINGRGYDLRLYTNKIAYNGANIEEGLLDPDNIVELDLTTFRTFRVTVDQNAAVPFKLYIDGNPQPALATEDYWFDSPGFDKLVFGDLSTGGVSGRSDWDFISWSTEGAFDLALPGDYNQDGTINLADYTVWRDNLGATGTPGLPGDGDDGSGTGVPDGLVDASDYLFWKNQLTPALSLATSRATAIPEPSAKGLLSLLGLFVLASACGRSGVVCVRR